MRGSTYRAYDGAMFRSGRWQRLFGAGALVLAGAGSCLAHHSDAAYDMDRAVAVSGVLRKAVIENPHSHYVIAVPGKTGGQVYWTLEGSGAGYVFRSVLRFNAKYFATGQPVVAELRPSRDGSRTGLLVQMRFSDGRLFKDLTLP